MNKLINDGIKKYRLRQGWGAGAGVFGSLEPEPLGKKSGSGVGAAKKLAGSSALLENQKYTEIVLVLFFFRKNSKFLWLNKQLFYLFLNFLQFYLTSLRGKEYFVKLNQ